MQIQSLSVVVPNKRCVNNCPFCVSRMLNNSNEYPNLMDINHPRYDINVREYLKRLRFVADNGCQTLILTGTSEPQQNKQFLATFALLHQQIGSPFTNIEMQTTGMGLHNNRDYIRFLRNFVGVNTVALSINSMGDKQNLELLGHTENSLKPSLVIAELCALLKEYDFNIRCCINLTDAFNNETLSSICKWAVEVAQANQITFRWLYASDEDTPQSKWIKEHKASLAFFQAMEQINYHGYPISKTEYGAKCHDIMGASVVFDGDCMGKNPKSDVKKFLILRPNCKLYSQWDSTASLVF